MVAEGTKTLGIARSNRSSSFNRLGFRDFPTGSLPPPPSSVVPASMWARTRRTISTSSATNDFVGELMPVSITLLMSRVNDLVICAAIGKDTCVPAVPRSRVNDLIGNRPLSARSVLASALLGSDQARLTLAELVGLPALFGISDRAARTSLWRRASNGELAGAGGGYAL